MNLDIAAGCGSRRNECKFYYAPADDENVRNLRQDDAYVLRFLHFCNFDVDEALKKVCVYAMRFECVND